MTFNSDIEKVKGEIKMLQSKLALLEEMERYNEGPAKEAFKKIYGVYPTFPIDVRFGYFKAGYEAAQSLVDDANKITAASMTECFIEGEPPNGCRAWSEWYELFGSKGILHKLKISSLDNKIPECPDKPPEEEYKKPLILYDMLTQFSNSDVKNYICEVVSRWLPDPDEGEDRYACGWNDCVEKLHLRLKND